MESFAAGRDLRDTDSEFWLHELYEEGSRSHAERALLPLRVGSSWKRSSALLGLPRYRSPSAQTISGHFPTSVPGVSRKKKKRKKRVCKISPRRHYMSPMHKKTSANIACACVTQPGDLGFSWLPECWHNKQSAISLQPCHRAKLKINCSSNSRLPPIHLFFSLLSLPLPRLVFHPWLAWRSLRLITGKDPINKLSSHKTV